MAIGSPGKTATTRRGFRGGRGGARAGHDADRALELRSATEIAHGARIQHLETLQHQAKAKIEQLKKELETAKSQSEREVSKLNQDLKDCQRISLAKRSQLARSNQDAQRQAKANVAQVKQDLRTLQLQSQVEAEEHGQERDQLKQELEGRIKDMNEDELLSLYTAGTNFVQTQNDKILELQAEIVKLKEQHEKFVEKGAHSVLIELNTQFAATDVAQRQVIERLEGEVKDLKAKLELAEKDAAEREQVMMGQAKLLEDYKKHTADVEMSV